MSKLGVLFLSMILTIPMIILHGFVLSKLWLWFVVPTFGLVPLGVTTAMGLGLVISYTTHQMENNNSDSSDEELIKKMFKAIFLGLVRSSLALLFGWVITLFM